MAETPTAEEREATEQLHSPLEPAPDIAGDPGPDLAAPPPDDPDEPSDRFPFAAQTDSLLAQLLYRVLFAEAALTIVVRDLEARGIAPKDFEQKLISEAEATLDAIGADRHLIKGRAGLVAAHLDDTAVKE